MDTKKERLEDFKAAISSTVRSLSNSEKIEVIFGNQTTKSFENSIILPDLDQSPNKLNYEEIRALADSKSLRLRFSNEKTLKNTSPRETYQKNFIIYLKKLDVRKLEQVISKA